MDVHLVTAVGMNGEFRFRSRARGREDVCRFIRLHRHIVATLTFSMAEEFFPGDIAPRLHGCWLTGSIQNDHALDTTAAHFQGSINDLFELRILTFTIRDIRGKNEARAGCLHPVAQCLPTKTCKHNDVNGANAHGSEHQHNRLGTGRHVNRDAVAFLNAHPTEGCRQSLHFVEELRIGEQPSLAAFVEIDQGSMPTPTVLDMIVKRIVGQIRLPTNEPAERGRCPLEHAIPLAKPRQLFCRSPPKFFWVLPGILNPTLHYRTYQVHESTSTANGL